MRSKLSALALLVLTPITTYALGINCHGSSSCPAANYDLPRVANIIQGDGADPGIPDDRFYQNGEHIYCKQKLDNFLCVFLQNSGGAPGHSIKTLVGYLRDHGCTECGSVPLFFPKDNDVKNGEVTFNIVADNRGCVGYC